MSIRLIAVLAVVMLPAAGRAQARLTGADIDGTVTDQNGGTVPGCTIVVTQARAAIQPMSRRAWHGTARRRRRR